jgi:tetratricopeptide (TPR) repeat protein
MLTFFKGNTEISLQQFDKAESDYTRAITLKDNLTEETNKSFNFRQASDYEKKRYVDASIAEVYRHRSEARLSMNNYTGAIADVDEAVKMIFSQMEGKEAIYNTKAAIYMAQNDNTNALSWLNKALDASPDYAIARVNRAIVKFNLAYKTSVISSEISIKSNPGSNFRLNLPDKTKTVVIKDNIESALVDCNKAIEADPSYAYAYYIRGVIKMGLDQPDYCYDILKSEQLGFTAAKAVIEELKCR